MKKQLVLLLSLSFICLTIQAKKGFSPYKVEVNHYNDTSSKYFVQDHRIYSEGWDALAQPHFWKTAITLTNDSGIMNIGSTRKILDVLSVDEWENKSPEYKKSYRDSIKEWYCLPADEHIYFTTGKSHFYDFGDVIPSIDRAVRIFEEDSTDPFFAQAILLIESPGRPKKSPVGAYGSFQLMKSVAIQMGLTVNSKVDERKDFDKCAQGAAKLLRTVCIPETNKMLTNRKIEYSEDDLWYKLLVLHVYHAGAYNVGKALNCIPEDKRVGNEIITQLWDVECGSFRNASQNYTQVALASLIELENIILKSCESIQPLAAN